MIAIVPARGGSKGLPRKNILPLSGLPLIVHTLNVALASNAISRVIVTTDDAEIIDTCRAVKGVEIPFKRPAYLAEDNSNAVDVFFHLLDWLAAEEKLIPDSFCVLQPTSPLRLAKDIDGAVKLFEKTDALAVLSVTNSKPLPWYHYLKNNSVMVPLEMQGESVNPMEARQNMSNLVVQNGAVHVFNTAELRETRSYYGPKTYGFVMPAIRSIDIDDAMDFSMAEALMNSKMSNHEEV